MLGNTEQSLHGFCNILNNNFSDYTPAQKAAAAAHLTAKASEYAHKYAYAYPYHAAYAHHPYAAYNPYGYLW